MFQDIVTKHQLLSVTQTKREVEKKRQIMEKNLVKGHCVVSKSAHYSQSLILQVFLYSQTLGNKLTKNTQSRHNNNNNLAD